MKKNIKILGIAFLLLGCLSQEITPKPDQNTRACLLREITGYFGYGNTWNFSNEIFEYNKDGNPSKRVFYDDKRNIVNFHIIEYENNRIKVVKNYKGKEEKPANLESYKTYDISDDFMSMVVHIFVRKENSNDFREYDTEMFDFIRNSKGELKPTKIANVNSNAKPKDDSARTGYYVRYEYDDENKNLFRVWIKLPNQDEIIQNEQIGFDRDGKSPWNANLWLSLMRNYGGGQSFLSESGFWSENNLSLNNRSQYYIYELNAEGFPCITTLKNPDYTNFPLEVRWYYFNCDCRK